MQLVKTIYSLSLTARDKMSIDVDRDIDAGCLAAVPIADPEAEIRPSGNVPSALNPPKGCRFIPGARDGMEYCRTTAEFAKQIHPLGRKTGEGLRILCHIPIEKLKQMDQGVHG